MIFHLSVVDRSHFYGKGYIAGTESGIVTIKGKPAIRPVSVYWFPPATLQPILVARVWSQKNGRYLIQNLDASKQYLVMCRDLPRNGHEQRYEPVVWDYVTPATDLTVKEQQELWQSWQDELNQDTG